MDQVTELQKAYQEYEASRFDYEAKKKISEEAYAAKEEKKLALVEAMRAIKMKSWKTEDNTSISIVAKPYFTVASTEELKKDLRKRKMVKQFFYETLDKTRLNSYMIQLVKQTGEVLPGVDHEMRETISIRQGGEK